MSAADRTPLSLAARDARRLLLFAQGLGDPPRRRMDAAACLSLVERMGFVQVDSVQTVERAHHMILSSRSHGYRQPLLTRLVERDRTLFENWTHDAAVIPTRFFPYWRRRFARERQRFAQSRWWRERAGDFDRALERVRARLAAEGRLMARDFDGERNGRSAGWWDWTPSKMALEFLWRTGEVAIAGREGFQKIYDLTERVVPAEARAATPDEAEIIDWACRSALDRLCVATAGELAAFWDLVSVAEARDWIARQGPDTLVPVTVAAAEPEMPRIRAVAVADIEARLAATPAPSAGLRLLSPFDPVVRDRRRARRLFGFDYRFEAFTPAARRVYGYYVFPILEGDRMVGRIDIRAARAEGALVLAGLWWEKGTKPGVARRAALDRELDRIRRFAGLDRVVDARGAPPAERSVGPDEDIAAEGPFGDGMVEEDAGMVEGDGGSV